MAKIHVKKPFVLNTVSGHRSFVAGHHEVEDEVASHWYVQHHAEVVDEQVGPVQESSPVVGADRSQEWADFMAAFEGYEPDAPGGKSPKKKGRKG